MNVLADVLERLYPEISAMQFYRNIFPAGELDNKDAMTKGKYTGIAVEVFDKQKHGKRAVLRHTVTDDLDMVERLQHSDAFCIMSPISYAGKSRKSSNARFMYALVVEVDNLIVDDSKRQEGLHRLMKQWSGRVHLIPQPTYVVASGTGLHLYYQFEQPIPMYPHIVESIAAYKKDLTDLIWNRHVTESNTPDRIQYESMFQAFRMVGTRTKLGDKVRAFVTGEKVTIDYMNRFIFNSSHHITQLYHSVMSLEEAKEMYPEWYEKRIVQGAERGRWVCKEDLYNWWLRKIGEGAEAVVGHRYYCMMCLCIYAIKCDISRERLEQDCFALLDMFEERTDDDNNHFTEKDVMDALQAFEDRGLVTYPVNSISYRSGIHIEKNKRNGRKQVDHAKYMRGIKKLRQSLGENVSGGRPSARDTVLYYLMDNPEAKKCDVIRETGLSKTTVYKYYDEIKNVLGGDGNADS